MKNGTDRQVIEQFNRISSLPDNWDHNRQYQKYLIKHIPRGCGRVLDVGCGTGELTKKLSVLSREVTGIDVAENMISEARRRNDAHNITYINVPAERFLAETGDRFDVIISVAALHHMDEQKVLELMKNRLEPDGLILILDLVEDRTPSGLLFSFFAMLLNPVMYLVKRKRFRAAPEEKAAWADHFRCDRYLSVREAKAAAEKALGKAKVKRHLFWRYSIVYRNG
jgi:2-polyprenyl-3-methyl-5-hydroxy-6-metoxy-1,4-benzoquinol methylase